MENIATKKFTYDHASSYKSRGKIGAASRNVRAQRASENRLLNRMDEVAKRRRMPLSPLVDENVEDKDVTAGKNDEKHDKASYPELSRREKLLKWREERKQKKGTEPQKKSFVVRHMKYENEALLFSNAMKKVTKGAAPLIKPSQYAVNKPEKRVTRASARIAKQSSNAAADSKTSAVKKVEPKSKAASSDKLKEKTEVNPEKTGRMTRQSLRTKASSSAKGVTTSQSSKKVAAEPKNQVKTRSQAKKANDTAKDQAPSEVQCPSKPDQQPSQTPATKEKTPAFEKLSFPALDNIKNTVSVGRGSSEGVERGQSSTGSGTEAPPSFAPANFQFTAPSGVNTFTYFSKTFKFQPLSPNSAAEFMFPSSAASFFSPKRDKASDQKQAENAILEDPVAVCHINNELEAQESNQKQQDDQEMKDAAAETCVIGMETHDGSEKQDVVENDNVSTACLTDAEIPSTQQQPETTGEVKMDADEVIETQDVEEEQHDATYFRNLVRKETDRLNEICAKWEKINAEEKHLSEEVTGQIRTTIGQAQLLIAQRFRQFSGLIDLSEDKQAEKQATASDLQGFWEMVYFQVEDVNAKFDALEKLKENNWKEEKKKARKITEKSKAKKPTAGDAAKPSNKVAAARNRIQEMRMAMKAKMAADKEKMRAEKRHQEEEAFVTILTPVNKSKKNDDSNDVVLTPVRRSVRKTPQKRSMLNNNTPVVVTTPKIISENSPGLRLTPDYGNQLNELVITGASVEIQSDTREGDARGMGDQPQENEMQCDLEEEKPAVLKSACKTTESTSRKTPGKVTFQSPDQARTPECAVLEVACSPMVTAVLDSEGSTENRTKKSTPQRFSARKCRGRIGTPFYQEAPRRRVSTVHEDSGREAESEGRSSSDSDSTEDKAAERCPGSGLRRSARKTPSKYRDSTPMDATSDQAGKTPAEVSVKLFYSAEESTTKETPKNGVEQDAFSKYLCPSSSDEEDCEKEPMVSSTTENVFEKKETLSENLAVNESVNLTPPEEPHNFIKPSITNSSDPKTGRTPIHILRYLSDMDTPSPNSRQITPMPKTTIFVSPSGTSKTPALVDSFGMMSPEHVVRRFPAKSDSSPLLAPAPVAGKESQAPVTPCSQLAAFSLESPVNGEKRRDSVFFAPISTAVVKAQDNLMSFSPVVEGNEANQE
ncbi:uncharacterized protein LOC144645274 isoform X3 [Oculina patagonica]